MPVWDWNDTMQRWSKVLLSLEKRKLWGLYWCNSLHQSHSDEGLREDALSSATKPFWGLMETVSANSKGICSPRAKIIVPCLPCALHKTNSSHLKNKTSNKPGPFPFYALQILPADMLVFINSSHVVGGNLGTCRFNEFISLQYGKPCKSTTAPCTLTTVLAL